MEKMNTFGGRRKKPSRDQTGGSKFRQRESLLEGTRISQKLGGRGGQEHRNGVTEIFSLRFYSRVSWNLNANEPKGLFCKYRGTMILTKLEGGGLNHSLVACVTHATRLSKSVRFQQGNPFSVAAYTDWSFSFL